ncbi:hypothetical protein FIV42_25925 [Persicimonas caeni]|uniref:Translocation and assembly module TamB C-terminal domain-containing protein n=1 Tax=Persicimonas caeni TaxID=2292766 RepID=A0A4Y6Q228_PERCE|nr:translocation/assembly module TamB [Persicimonas caeni]QDG54055.1 hypothetical protein FIV42_25925 [Persicimonas caeni]QED35276.1 hypothetical protein FRD00_25920 [Persicimonas caeni]
MRKWLKRLGITLGVIVGLLVLVLLGAWIYLQTGAGKSFLKDRILSAARGSLEGELEIDRIEGGLLGGAELYGVILRDARGNVAARVPEASADYDLLQLLESELRIESISVERPLVVARRYDDGTLNLATLTKDQPEEKKPPSQFQASIARAAIDDGLLVWVDDQATETNLSEERRADLEAWLERLDEPEASIGDLQKQIVSILSGTTQGQLSAAAATGLELRGSFNTYGGSALSGKLERLAAEVHTDATQQAHEFVAENLDLQRSAGHLETTLATLRLGSLASARDITAAVDFQTRTDELGNKVVMGIDEFFVQVARADVDDELVGAIAPDAPITGPITASASVGGTLKDFVYLVRFGCGSDPSTTLAGTAAFAGDDFTQPRYDAAAVFSQLRPSRCIDLGGRNVDLTGALLAAGEGINPEELTAEARVALENSQVDDYRVDAMYLKAAAKDGTYSVDRFETITPYGRAEIAGSFGLDGDYRVQLEVDANEEMRQLSEQLGQGELSTKFARIRLVSEGKLDLDAQSPLGYVERGELTADWRLQDFQLENNAIGSSRGDVFTRIGPVEGQPDARFVEFSADIRGANVDLPDFAAQSLAVDAKGQGVLQLPVDDFLGALRSLSSSWDVRVDRLSTPSIDIQAADIQAELDRRGLGSPFSWDIQGSLRGGRFQDNRVGSAKVDLEGTAQVDQTPEGPELGRFSAKGTADVTDLRAGDNKIQQGRLRLDLSGDLPSIEGSVGIDATGVEAAGEQLESLQAEIELGEDRQFDITARAERKETGPISLEAAGKADADFQEFELRQFELETPEATLSVPEGAKVELTEDGVRFDQLRLETDDQFLTVEGTFRTRGKQDLRVELGNVKVGELREKFGLEKMIPPVRATVNGELSIEGTARNPVINIELYVTNAYYEGYGPLSAKLLATYRNRLLNISELSATAYDTKILAASGELPLDLNLSGDVDIPRNRKMDLQMRVPTLTLQEFYEPLPVLEEYNAAGTIFANLYLAGTIQNPRIQVQLSGDNIGFAGDIGGEYLEIEQVTTSLKADYTPPSGGRGGIDARYRLVWRGEPVVEARASTPMPLADWVRRTLDETRPTPDWDKALAQLPFKLSLEVSNLDLGEVPLESFAEADAEGDIVVDIDGAGTFSDPRLNLELRADDFGWEQYRDIYVATELRLRDQMVHIDQLRFEWDADEIFVASGKFPLPTETIVGDQPLADLPIDLTVQLNKVPISKLQAIDYSFARYKGVLAGYATVSGTLSEPDIDGRAGLFDTEMARGQTGSIAVSFSAENGRLKADAFVCRRYNQVMTAEADVPITTDILALARGASVLDEGQIQARIKSDPIQLATLVPGELVDQYVSDPEGLLEIDVDINGTWEQPRILGNVLIEDGAVTLPVYGRRFTDIDLNVQATRERVAIKKLNVAEGDSWVRADGTLNLEGFTPTELEATIKSKEFNFGGFAEGFAAYVTSTIDVDGDFTGEADRIRAHAKELEVTIPEDEGGDLHPTELDEEIVVLKRHTDQNQVLDLENLLEQPEAEEEDKTPLQIRFVADRGSWLRHPIANVEFTADVTVNLAGPRVSMLGTVDTVRGNAELLGKEFEVPEQENAVRFTGASPPNPVLDIRALNYLPREITEEIGEPSEGEPRVIVRVTGRAQEPKLVFESDPLLSETEIIFVLMTGRPPGQAGAGEESRVSGLALGAASGIFASLLQQQLAGTLPLDVVRVQPGQEGFRDARVQVGTYLTEEIFVSYSLRLGAEEGEGFNVFKIDYRFAPRWKLELQSSEQLTGQFNIFWDVY